MKTEHLTSSLMLVGSAALSSLLLASSPCSADEASIPSEVEATIPRSVFQMPEPGFVGRDPFYPNSARIMTDLTPVVSQRPVSGDLVLKAISGTASRPLAMINGVTFEVGEEREVRTALGRVRVRLVSVDGLKVTISVGSEKRELRLRDQGSESAETSLSTEPETAQLAVPGQL